MNLFWKIVERGVIRYIKGKRLNHISTNDLDSERNPKMIGYEVKATNSQTLN